MVRRTRAGGRARSLAGDLKTLILRGWCDVQIRLRMVRNQESVWLFGAFCAERDVGAALVVESVSTAAMNAHLAIISQAVLANDHAAVLVDGAGFHAQSKDLVVPSNITLVTLPTHSPELNPAEGVWEFLKNGELMHRLYRTADEIIDRCCSAWKSLANETGRIRSLCSYPWLMGKPGLA